MCPNLHFLKKLILCLVVKLNIFIFCVRCKLFFKKDDAFADKGVGTLYIKSLEDTTQLLVRADTSLGEFRFLHRHVLLLA